MLNIVQWAYMIEMSRMSLCGLLECLDCSLQLDSMLHRKLATHKSNNNNNGNNKHRPQLLTSTKTSRTLRQRITNNKQSIIDLFYQISNLTMMMDCEGTPHSNQTSENKETVLIIKKLLLIMQYPLPEECLPICIQLLHRFTPNFNESIYQKLISILHTAVLQSSGQQLLTQQLHWIAGLCDIGSYGISGDSFRFWLISDYLAKAPNTVLAEGQQHEKQHLIYWVYENADQMAEKLYGLTSHTPQQFEQTIKNPTNFQSQRYLKHLHIGFSSWVKCSQKFPYIFQQQRVVKNMLQYVQRFGLGNPYLLEAIDSIMNNQELIQQAIQNIADSVQPGKLTQAENYNFVILMSRMGSDSSETNGSWRQKITYKWLQNYFQSTYSTRSMLLKVCRNVLTEETAVQIYRVLMKQLEDGSMYLDRAIAGSLSVQKVNSVGSLLEAIRGYLGNSLECLSGLWIRVNRELSRPNFSKINNYSLAIKCIHIHIYFAYKRHFEGLCKDKQQIQQLNAKIITTLQNDLLSLNDPIIQQCLCDISLQLSLALPDITDIWNIEQVIRDRLESCCEQALLNALSYPEKIQQKIESYFHSAIWDKFQKEPINTSMRYPLLYLLYQGSNVPFVYWHKCIEIKQLETTSIFMVFRSILQERQSFPEQYLLTTVNSCIIKEGIKYLFCLTLQLVCFTQVSSLYQALSTLMRTRRNCAKNPIDKITVELLDRVITKCAYQFLSSTQDPKHELQEISSLLADNQRSKILPSKSLKHAQREWQNMLELDVYNIVIQRDFRINQELQVGSSLAQVNGKLRRIHKIKYPNDYTS